MNRLQRLETRNDYFVSLNPLTEPRQESIVAEFDYEHPVFTTAAGLAFVGPRAFGYDLDVVDPFA